MFSCHICTSDDLREVTRYASLNRVTSDCKLWSADEDPIRQGQRFMGRSVLGPGQVSSGSVVFVGVGGGVAEHLARRLARHAPSVSWMDSGAAAG